MSKRIPKPGTPEWNAHWLDLAERFDKLSTDGAVTQNLAYGLPAATGMPRYSAVETLMLGMPADALAAYNVANERHRSATKADETKSQAIRARHRVLTNGESTR